MNKRTLITTIMSLMLIDAHATNPKWSLDSLRARAISNNKELLMVGQKKIAAHYIHKSATTNYFPKVSTTGAYTYTSREVSLLNDKQKHSLSNIGTTLSTLVPDLSSISSQLNSIGQGLVETLRTDTRHAGAISVTLTQPLYMGGKIRAYNNITQYAEQATNTIYDKTQQDIIVNVEETYWTLVTLHSKKSWLKAIKHWLKNYKQMLNNL